MPKKPIQTDEELLNSVKNMKIKIGGVPKSTLFKNRATLIRRFGGTWNQVLIRADITPDYKPTRGELIQQLKEKAKKLGKTPSLNEFKNKNMLIRYCGSWNNAVTEAGLIPTTKIRTSKELVERVQILAKKLSKTPTVLDYIAEYGGIKVVRDRFGTWNKFLKEAGIKSRASSKGKKIVDYMYYM